jgi:hypothetical protein
MVSSMKVMKRSRMGMGNRLDCTATVVEGAVRTARGSTPADAEGSLL